MKMHILFILLAGACCLFSCSSSDVKATAEQEKVYDVIVVGAGGGGLGAAARLALAGKSVLVLEQHDKVGGYMTAFYRDDYRFEVSLHAMDGLDPGGSKDQYIHHGHTRILPSDRGVSPAYPSARGLKPPTLHVFSIQMGWYG